MPNVPRGAPPSSSPTWKAASSGWSNQPTSPRIRCGPCCPSICAAARAAWKRRRRARLPYGLCAGRSARRHRRRPHQPGAGADRQASRLRRHHRRPAHRFRHAGAFSGRESDRRMAGQGAAAAQCRPLHRFCRAHPRSEDRRPGPAARARARLLLYRRARLAKDPRAPPRAAQAGGRERRRLDAHPRAYRSRHRRGLAGRDRGRDHGADHRAAARGQAGSRAPLVKAAS